MHIERDLKHQSSDVTEEFSAQLTTNRERHMQKLHQMLQWHLLRQGVGVLATASKDGTPHATVLATLASPSLNRLITMTSPESRKILHILENPRVEWLFFDPDKATLLYLRGTVKVLEEMAQVEAAWKQLPDKSRAFFLSYQSTVGIQFLILETLVDSVEYSIPRKNKRFSFSINPENHETPGDFSHSPRIVPD